MAIGNRIICFLLCVVFLLFAYWQLNDPDPFVWIPPYLYISLTGLSLAIRPKINIKKLLLLSMAIFSVWAVTFIPDFAYWIKMGTPSISGDMQQQYPYIELVREFGGLLISLLANSYFYFLMRKND